MLCNPSIPVICWKDKGCGHSRTAGHRCRPSWRYTLSSFSLSLCLSMRLLTPAELREVRRGQGGKITRKASPISECELTARTGWSPAFYCSQCRPEPSRCPRRNEMPSAPGECQISANAAEYGRYQHPPVHINKFTWQYLNGDVP